MAAQYYQHVYLLIVTLLTLLVMNQYNPRVINDLNRTKTAHPLMALLICIGMFFFIGMRPVNGKYFVDMPGYYESYVANMGRQFVFDRDVLNLFFDNWIAYMASLSIPVTVSFIIYAAVYFGMMWLACWKIFPKDMLLAFVVCLAAFSTFSYATNGMKAGMAASTFLVALAYRDKLWISIPLAIFTMGQHHSMLLVVAAYFMVLLIRKPKFYFWFWLFCFAIATLHITAFQRFFAGYTDEHGAEYLLSMRNSGFRIDFILYSAVPILIGYYMIYKHKIVNAKNYNTILNLYMATNGFWLLCMYSNFTNRISYLSWFLYPIVLLYPFVNLRWSLRQITYLKYAVYGHLGFTLIMHYVYYVFLHD